MTGENSVKKERGTLKYTVLFSAVAGLVVMAFTAGRSFAAGIPSASALTYGGILQSANGTPLTGSHTIEVRFWSAPSGGSTLCTSGEQEEVPLKLGRFSLSLPDACTEAVKDNSQAYVEVVLDQVSLGRARANAVPYAVEAAHAVVATDVAESGALDQRLKALEEALSRAVPAGMISPFAGEQVPAGWLRCNGEAVSRAQYPALFSAVSTKWGPGDGASSFNLPDLRGRVAIGAGQASGLSERIVGQTLGEEMHALTIAEMPSHGHQLTTVPDSDMPGGYSGGGWFGDPVSRQTSLTGGDLPHNNMQPSAVVNYIIKY